MRRLASFLVLVLLTADSRILHAYDTQTHREIGERAADSAISSVDRVLKDELGVSRGILEKFLGHSLPRSRTVQELIGDGAFFEDVPPTRSLNHFHNPLRAWEDAGLRALTVPILGFDLIRGQSSLLWQQNTSQDTTFVSTPIPLLSGGGNWSWQHARQHYLNALTRSRKEDVKNQPGRDTAFVEMFEALGRLTHLLQDATLPAHVRNDAHPDVSVLGIEIPFLGGPDWYEKWVENTRTDTPSLFQDLLNRYNKDVHRPPFSIFTPTRHPQAPVPIARLLDTDKFLGLNSSVLTDRDIGISEYTNGNFLSRDTIFTDFVLPRQSSLDPTFIVEPIGSKFRRYLQKTLEGETVDHFITEGLLHNTLKEVLEAPVPAGGWTLDDEHVQKDYAAKLLPRAVGYSAGLLDYFFRGKLDVDLFPTGDPTVFELKGTNATQDDALVDGTLALYTDADDGTRIPVLSRDALTVRDVRPGQQISDATSRRRFEAPADAERFIAVYRGTLGNELKDDANNFPGAVIGKVLGGVRAESIFFEGDRRRLRTVHGIFPLPLIADRLQRVQWGDQDNTFVGTRSNTTNPLSPDQVVAFKIDRPLGFSDPPPLDQSGFVKTAIQKSVDFPFNLSLGVTVNYSQNVRFQHSLLIAEVTETNIWRGTFYEPTFAGRAPTGFEVTTDQPFRFAQNFPIILDQAHLLERAVGLPRPYFWQVEEVALDSQGRVLALVRVELTFPNDDMRTVRPLVHGSNCLLAEGPPQTIRASFMLPGSRLLWALIDVERREVLGVTSEPSVSISSEILQSPVVQEIRKTVTFVVGGPRFGLPPLTFCALLWPPGPDRSFPIVEEGSVRFPPSGTQSQTISGWFRSDLDALVNVPLTITTAEGRIGSNVYFVDRAAGINRAIAFVITRSGPMTGSIVVDPRQARIVRPVGSSPEVLLFSAHFRANQGAEEGLLVRWSPQAPSRTSLVLPEKLPLARPDYTLRSVTSGSALLEARQLQTGQAFALMVDFDSRTTQSFPFSLLLDYVLLEPKFLYNVRDTKFHTVDPSLRLTALPRPLAPPPPTLPRLLLPLNAYHLIRLR